jgi:hypothetical protein
MKTQAVNVKLQLPRSSFINTDGDFDNGIVHMNMGMVFQYDYLEAQNSSCLDNTDQMGRLV